MKPTLKELSLAHNGSEPDHGINWTWFYFKTIADANAFLADLDKHGYEHRGLYPNPDGSAGVRAR
jgi:hypothetical protein